MSRSLSRGADRAVAQFRITRHPLRCLSANDPCGLRGGPFPKDTPAGETRAQPVDAAPITGTEKSTGGL
ncbi:MAG: hypothetical protein AAGJ32_00385 [Pseudomonadota bacterium]